MNKLYLFFALLTFGIGKAQCTGAEPGPNPGDTGCVTFTYDGVAVEYTTVRAADGNIWMQQNLGSSHIGVLSTDDGAYGDLFQWGRWADGHQKRTSVASATAPTPNNPLGLGTGIDDFYIGDAEWWSLAEATDKWEAPTVAAVTDTNGCDPCRLIGLGWRLPTEAEWEAIVAAENITSIQAAFDSNLKLTIAGNRSGFSGNLSSVGARGYYWSSTVSDNDPSYSKYFYFTPLTINTGAGAGRDQGSSVRCIKMPQAQPTGLLITPANNAPATITVPAGTLQLTAAVTPATANQNVTWSITTGSTFATISESGLVTASANGTVTVQAVSVEDATVLDTIDVVITGQIIPAEGLVISTLNNVPAAISLFNGTLQLVATVLPAEANQNVTWSIITGGTFATISESGLVSATANGTVTVQAVSVQDATVLDTIDIVITNQNVASAAPYCDAVVDFDVEPISLVQFAGIDNATSAVVNATPPYESFINLTGNVQQGQTYTLTVKGNTVGLFEHDIRVFIDWNQNEVFDMDTEYYATSIQNTTGNDAVTATLDITVPATATLGTTRMRITKDQWNVYEPGDFDACTNAYYGQVEDYSLQIAGPTAGANGVTATAFTIYPNPVNNILTIDAAVAVKQVTVYTTDGRTVTTANAAQVNFSNLAAGLYLIKIDFENGSEALHKVIKN
ncbi:GEVED domain-containing protein [Flavobacterium subsaxonicum]|uniref:BIG2 domain-containing protein n=1 Tax=Flavobacterium subsaxonicum WB 4.1-42 = DSM 21790 TaxID=1121898 RepID=A0A0A2MLE0_9FLAO|nr:GEVED domain-containing protein [Flavobacterium subsaxonicum]KGO92401.1 hypothetical protein Q766_13140 [Flavobacterium subsaxonicum WB 4.1-42 = DSM 21790]